MNSKYLSILFVLLSLSLCTKAQDKNLFFEGIGCKVELKNNILVAENNTIKRTWLWNSGNITSLTLENKLTKVKLRLGNKTPDLYLLDDTIKASDAQISTIIIPNSNQYTQHLLLDIQYKLKGLAVKKVIRIYPNCAALATEIYFKGRALKRWFKSNQNANSSNNIEDLPSPALIGKMPFTEQLALGGKHWKIKTIEFTDVTDLNNTLVKENSIISYWFDALLKGNILFARNLENDEGVFISKEAPNPKSQLHYPNGDFLVGSGNIRMVGLGVDSADLNEHTWTKAYGYVTGIFKGNEANATLALRNYQKLIRPLLPGRDEMVMLNTWGDRAKDTKVNEAFCLSELKSAARLGITHFQIDDGWQAGKSANSAFIGSFKDIWSNPNYWQPDPVKFPNGLGPLVSKGKSLGIEICLWFNPSIQNNFSDWEKDAKAILDLYKKYGIRVFKIDGLSIPNKVAEVRLRMLFDRIMEESNWNIVLNLDATAGIRGGYNSFNQYGNVFLENRYTDWGNYYPYLTLRNLWMLSRYFQPQLFQIEFLNKWRNQEKYIGDRFAPINYSFNYLFAITLMAQPLAWMEATNLPEEAFLTGITIRSYRKIQHDLHNGNIFPIGDEPSGTSWSGFESIKANDGYLLVFREDNLKTDILMATSLISGKKVKLNAIIGNGKSFSTVVGKNGTVQFSLPKINSFALYYFKYQ